MPREALEKTGVTIRDAGPDDTVSGVPPRWVALPETTEEIAALLRACAEHDLAVVAVGGGSKLHWGRRPDRCDVLLDTCCLNEVLEHAAGDLVVRAQAGVPMEALAAVLAERGQELALDVPVEGATVGGTLATATAGPRALRYGTPRDLLIGITVVLADGTIARSGGRVVKNVAGYDLGKLFTGSHGTLGVIAEATFRLHPLPAGRRWVTATFPGPTGEAGPGWTGPPLVALAASQAEPSAVEIDWPAADGPFRVSVLLEGHAAESRALAVRALLGTDDATVTDGPPPGWGLVPGEDLLVEVRAPAERAADTMTEIFDAARDSGLPVASRMWLGDHLSAFVALPGDTDPVAAAAFVSELSGDLDPGGRRTRVVAAPEEAARRMDRWGHVGALKLMRLVKERFDPGRRMSPGRFVGGI